MSLNKRFVIGGELPAYEVSIHIQSFWHIRFIRCIKSIGSSAAF